MPAVQPLAPPSKAGGRTAGGVEGAHVVIARTLARLRRTRDGTGRAGAALLELGRAVRLLHRARAMRALGDLGWATRIWETTSASLTRKLWVHAASKNLPPVFFESELQHRILLVRGLSSLSVTFTLARKCHPYSPALTYIRLACWKDTRVRCGGSSFFLHVVRRRAQPSDSIDCDVKQWAIG